MYYQKTITEVRRIIEEVSPGIKPKFIDLSSWGASPVTSSYILWMCDQVEEMDTSSIKHAVKAGRWIGYILSQMETRGYWSNSQSRALTREDHLSGLDLPHQK